MSKEIGRNDPCWCRSGKKYKKCHLDRDKQLPIDRAEIERHGKQREKKCSASELQDGLCSGSIIHAHTISKSGSLKTISESGHVMGTKPSLAQLIRNNGKLTLSKVGINQASTFTGFCSYHDKELFSPLEDFPITLSDEQLFLLAYRSLSRELYAKQETTKTAEFIRQSDRGQNIADQVSIQNSANAYGFGINLALQELHSIKAQMDDMLINKNFSSMNHCVIELASLPKVLVSASTQPEFDFSGNRLQNFGNPHQMMSHIIFNCISYDERGCFVFSWLDDSDDICSKFIDSLINIGEQDISNALVRFCYSFAENTWASPAWWESLNPNEKDIISERLQHGTPTSPHQSNCLTTDGVDFGAYSIAKVSLRKNSPQVIQPV
ncbi:putative cytoplasmic protein [Pseudomonas chlororaphis subsp. piscium]|uniref:YecA family protein n=1 Tax=Pseudomonas chlororaphis TaxID=587753 RepID=UPI000F6DE6C1|nr:SEC-C domain-containing protein [Pseudomonas chlororaphis]AZC86677.1 putative cytoplasmic protein [Pseudomonas chlororaphis subsp. piscium]